ncbi:MAG: tyrosine-type recombinase/integrase [Gemmatimonadaceae bacterium]
MAKHLPDAAAAVGTFMYWTGWRRNETLTREWRHVDLTRGTIVLEPGETKSGDGRTFPFDVLPELAAVLKRQREYTDQVERRTSQIVRWVFHREGRRVVSIRAAWRTACDKAGLAGKIPHDFRRTAVRRLERAGVPAQSRCNWSGTGPRPSTAATPSRTRRTYATDWRRSPPT